MGLLNGGIKDLFGSVFGGLYLDGTLHKTTLALDGLGGSSETFEDHAMKYQRDDRSDVSRDKVPATDVTVLILQSGMTVSPDTDDRFTTADGTYIVVSSRQDPAGSYWQVQGSPSSVQE